MATTYFDNYGTFTRTPDFLDNYEIPPSAKRIFTLLANLADVNGRVYICRSKIKEKINLAKTTISTLITTLEKAGLLERTGEFAHAIYPIVNLTPKKAEGVSEIKPPSFKNLTTPLAKSNPQLEQELDLKLKEQTPKLKPVCFGKFPKNENLEQQLKSLGMHKHPAKRLISRHPVEQIEQKIAQLTFLKSRGDQIRNAAGWVTSALKADFKPTTAQEKAHQQDQEQQENKKLEMATRLLREAEHAQRNGNLEKAQELAQRSLGHKAFSETKLFLSKLLEQLTHKQKLAHAKSTIPKEQQDQLFAECLAEQPTHIKSLRLDEVSRRILAEAQWHKRLIELATT